VGVGEVSGDLLNQGRFCVRSKTGSEWGVKAGSRAEQLTWSPMYSLTT
jgi:hypothetical protein